MASNPLLDALGLDIGGANLKAATATGTICTVPFALYRHPDRLPDALRNLLLTMPAIDRLAVTMTGELCDCYPTRREGVLAILDAVTVTVPNRIVEVWLTDGRLVALEAARQRPQLAAASNWLALAVYAGRFAPHGAALLLDTGSTTTDIIPLYDGRPQPQAHTDRSRLGSGELVYTGARRTPVCSVLAGAGAAELFATMADVYRVLGDLPEDANDHDTADGRPATQAHSHARLARMLCTDLDDSTEAERLALARGIADRQEELLCRAIRQAAARLRGPPRTVILAGSGSFVAARAWHRLAGPPCAMVDLGRLLGPRHSTAACAYALAVLARERMSGD